MSQQEIISILKKNKKPISLHEISIKLEDKMNDRTVRHGVSQLIKSSHIKIIEIDRHTAMDLYHCKRKMRLYYV